MKHLQGLQCHQSTMEFSLEKSGWRGRGSVEEEEERGEEGGANTAYHSCQYN